MYNFESLQFGGGSYYTVLFLGCLQQLMDNGTVSMNKIKTFGGSSAGSMIALLLIVGFTPKEILKEIAAVDLEDVFLNDLDIAGFFTNNGLCYGKKMVERLVEIVQKKIPEFTIKSNFAFLKKKTGMSLVVSGTNLTEKKIDLFCEDETPQMSVIYAIRLSISIPLIFRTLNFKNSTYIDGAWFGDIRDVSTCKKYFDPQTSLHFCIWVPGHGDGKKKNLLDIITMLRGYFTESFWFVDYKEFPYVIETKVESASYEKPGLLYLFQQGLVVANEWLKKVK
jgi:hypothetical protein